MGNLFKTAILLAALTCLVVLIGGAIGGQQGMLIAFVLAAGMNFASYWFSDRIVLSMYRARPVDEASAPGLYAVVRRLATRRICVSCQTNADPKATDRCLKCGGRLEQRADDNQDVVRERLNVYVRETKPVLEFYRERPTFRVVNGAQASDKVAQELDMMIDDAAAARA